MNFAQFCIGKSTGIPRGVRVSCSWFSAVQSMEIVRFGGDFRCPERFRYPDRQERAERFRAEKYFGSMFPPLRARSQAQLGNALGSEATLRKLGSEASLRKP